MKDLEEQLEDYRIAKGVLKSLQEHPGWIQLAESMKMIRVARRNQIFSSDSSTMDSLIDLGQVKSELAGMEFVLGYPKLLIDENDLAEKAVLLEMEMENEDQ